MRLLDWMLVFVVLLCLLTVCWIWYRVNIMREQLNMVIEPDTGMMDEMEYRIKGLERKYANIS